MGVVLSALSASAGANLVVFSAVLSGDAVVPPVATSAGGGGGFTLDDENVLVYSITVGGLATPTAIHIHGPAPVGENAPPIYTLDVPPVWNPSGIPTIVSGSVGPLSPTERGELIEGLWYVQFHTAANPSGELRGQIEFIEVSTADESWGDLKSRFEP
jgi:hypothetical protein